MPFDAEKMISLRIKRGLTQEQAANAAKIGGKQSWYRYELGKISPTIDTAEKIARALGVDVGELIRRK